jgi:hypothetical protein
VVDPPPRRELLVRGLVGGLLRLLLWWYIVEKKGTLGVAGATEPGREMMVAFSSAKEPGTGSSKRSDSAQRAAWTAYSSAKVKVTASSSSGRRQVMNLLSSCQRIDDAYLVIEACSLPCDEVG